MSNGSGPIIIRHLMAHPAVSIAEKMNLQAVLDRYELNGHKCGFFDARYVLKIVKRLIK